MIWVPLTLVAGSFAWWVVARTVEDDRGHYSDYSKLALFVSLIVAFLWTVGVDSDTP